MSERVVPRAGQRGGRRRPPRLVFQLIALAAVLVAGLMVLLTLNAIAGSDDQTMVPLTIPKGQPFRVAAESLAAHGVVSNARLFGLYARLRGRDRKIRDGKYRIRRGAGWAEILTALKQGRGIVRPVRIVEGAPLWEIVPLLSAELGIPTESLEAAVRDTTHLRRLLVPPGQTLEGYLYPDTYDFPEGGSARQAVNLMVRRFEAKWKPEWNARLVEVKMTRHQIVTLASIVEKEVRKASERPRVAAVYLNRLRIRMPLQADPTIQYAQRRKPGRVLYRDLRVDSPYNTYRHFGLPPGPIGSPRDSSISASLFPAVDPSRFFVAHPDGHHEFSRTYGEHLTAIERVRAVARADRLRARALDSALKAAGGPRATLDSATAKRP